MKRLDSGWDWFAGKAAPLPGSPDPAAAERDFHRAFARCFSSPDGARVLAHLRAMTIERAVGPDVSDAQLRHLEGQRQLIAYVLALIERGKAQSPGE